MQIQRHPGKKHQNAAALSRRPCHQCGRDTHDPDSPDSLGAITASQDAVPLLHERSSMEIRKLQLEYGAIGFVLRAMENEEKPTYGAARSQGPVAQRLTQLWESLFVREGNLHQKFDDCKPTRPPLSWSQLVLPGILQNEAMQELHAGALEGHLGAEKTHGKEDVKMWCHTCESCAMRKSSPVKNRAPMQAIKAGFPI